MSGSISRRPWEAVNGVVRPEDLKVAARNLAALAPKVPAFLPWHMRSAVRLGGTMAPVLPNVVIPIARRVLREMVGHLIVDARLGKHGFDFYRLNAAGRYEPVAPDAAGRYHSAVLPGFWLDPAWLEESPLPNLTWVLEEIAPGAYAELAEQARQERAARERT